MNLKNCFNRTFLSLIAIFCTFQAFSQSAHLKVGFGSSDITPSLKVKNWVTGKEYPSVQDSLNVRVLLLETSGVKGAIVSFDLVDAGESLTDEVRTILQKKLGIPQKNIIVTGTHTHSAPWAPVYKSGYRGKEKDTWWAIRYNGLQNEDPAFSQWMKKLLIAVDKAASEAKKSSQLATLWIGKSDISAYAQNRRPIKPTWGTKQSLSPKGYNYKHPEYDPFINMDGMNYGPLDRTMSVVSFRDSQQNNIVSLMHLSIHPVAIYPYSDVISADWPGEAMRQFKKKGNGPALFLQGTTGDINPWKRGKDAVNEMGLGIAERAQKAHQWGIELAVDPLAGYQKKIQLPLDKVGKERLGTETVTAEIQLITLGPIAIVTLPGEPLTDLGSAIRDSSPYPHTLVMGYSNGNGVHYSGMPAEKSKGGYEMEAGTIGTEQSGMLMVEAAIELLKQSYSKK